MNNIIQQKIKELVGSLEEWGDKHDEGCACNMEEPDECDCTFFEEIRRTMTYLITSHTEQLKERVEGLRTILNYPNPPSAHDMKTFKLGYRVKKIKGSEWQGVIVGTYSTALTPDGFVVESETHKGSCQIYPAHALELI